MLERLFGGDTLTATSRALDAASLRHSVISNNLANASTPGFKRGEVQFESQLARALSSRRDPCAPASAPLDALRPQVVTVNSTSSRADGNNVNLEAEGVSLAVNQLRYQFLAQSVAGQFSGLKNVINGGR